jgi:SAM-dependent methyltransferase
MNTVWDKIFTSNLFCTDLEPRDFVRKNLTEIPKSKPVLDVGCGCGRHTIYLAANGYDVYGLDNSSIALQMTQKHLDSFGLSAKLENGNMWDIPFNDISFAAALCINVLNHAMPEKIQSTVSAIASRLAPAAIFLATLLTDNDYRRCGEQVDCNTFICDRGPEKGVLHTFFNESSVNKLFKSSFEIKILETARGAIKIEDNKEVMMEFFCIKARKI